MRRYDLDWLRVIVFGLLIFYHVGMLFVPWGFHIKNNVVYDWVMYPMLFLNQWRLPILFVISGMGTYFALSKRSAGQFCWERIKRLFLPLVFGMLVIVPPQVYIERLVEGDFAGGYFDYWPFLAFNGIYPVGNLSWHHLWFLPYLLVYSLVLVPVFIYLRNHPNNSFILWIKRLIQKPAGLFVFIVPLYLLEAFMEPFYPIHHNLVNDWFNLTNSLLFFLFGYLLMTVKEEFWSMVQHHRKSYLICGVIAFASWIALVVSFEDSTLRHFTEAGIKVFNLWSWILALFGYAATYLNQQSRVLNYANEAVYPFYILHQSVMIVIASYLINLKWGFFPKASLLIVGTFGLSWLIYELCVRRWKLIRPLFGLK
ncbi:acyltransferase family protein [Reichenbachiella agarivorans]|uniref:Acyltransferase family protein n=1 Tax=Reichenbachiella agarivorans TaxID=2979464 RepID=A0ABY6CPW9_9BACT|nr:acyltransferase family protein [Reichenbachiella agarivorans]UXP31829.1 acyltransferase family protein [Reichenbachiella agarivorans]